MATTFAHFFNRSYRKAVASARSRYGKAGAIQLHCVVCRQSGSGGRRSTKAHLKTEDDATCLFADVEVVATYKPFNINRSSLGNLWHRLRRPDLRWRPPTGSGGVCDQGTGTWLRRP